MHELLLNFILKEQDLLTLCNVLPVVLRRKPTCENVHTVQHHSLNPHEVLPLILWTSLHLDLYSYIKSDLVAVPEDGPSFDCW